MALVCVLVAVIAAYVFLGRNDQDNQVRTATRRPAGVSSSSTHEKDSTSSPRVVAASGKESSRQPPVPTEGQNVLRGRVVFGETGDPAASVDVEAHRPSEEASVKVRTNESGVFAFEHLLPETRYVLQAVDRAKELVSAHTRCPHMS